MTLSPLVLIETGHAQSGGGIDGRPCLQSIHQMCCAGKNETANNSCAFDDAIKSGRCTAGACADGGGGASKPGGGSSQPSAGPSGSGNSGMACTNVFTFLCCDGKESSASNSCALNAGNTGARLLASSKLKTAPPVATRLDDCPRTASPRANRIS